MAELVDCDCRQVDLAGARRDVDCPRLGLVEVRVALDGLRRVRRHRREEGVREDAANAVEREVVAVVTGDEPDDDLRTARHRDLAEAEPGPARQVLNAWWIAWRTSGA